MTKRIGTGHFQREDGSEFRFVPVESEQYSWECVEFCAPVELTKEERQMSEAQAWDLEKVLLVKKMLLDGKSPSEINKATSISRNTVYKYKKVLSLKDTNLPAKYNENTEISKSVLSCFLIFSNLGNQSTMPFFLVLLPIVVLAIWGFFKKEMAASNDRKRIHDAEVSQLHFLFVRAFNLSYRREPIVVHSEIEERYYNSLLAHYNNQGRFVYVIEAKPGQSANSLFDEKENMNRAYCLANAEMIIQANKRAQDKWKELEEMGLLDYLYFNRQHRGNWERSKAFLYDAVAKLQTQPNGKDYARTKFIENLI